MSKLAPENAKDAGPETDMAPEKKGKTTPISPDQLYKGRRVSVEKAQRHAKLLARKAKLARPSFSFKPTHHCGGRIYWNDSEQIFRVYKRKGDRLDETIPVSNKTKDARIKFEVACAIIEDDDRPIVK